MEGLKGFGFQGLRFKGIRVWDSYSRPCNPVIVVPRKARV